MAKQDNPFGQPIGMFGFSRGMWSKTPKELIPNNASPYAKNYLWDEHNRLTKIFGTSLLLVEAKNAFAKNPIYNLYTHIEPSGSEVLIIQGENKASAVMKLWALRVDGGTVVDITPPDEVLALNIRMNFVTYKGRLYAWNGVNRLMHWNGETWKYYHTDQTERFQYLFVHNYRLWAIKSDRNPTRVIFTEPNECAFYKYYGEVGYPGDQNWYDFTTGDGSPVTGGAVFKNSAVITKPNHIYRIYGDPTYEVTIPPAIVGSGSIHHDSLKVRKDGTAFMMSRKGIEAFGDTGVIASEEDRRVQTSPNITRLTSEIDNYWEDNVTIPEPLAVKSHTWAGDTDFSAFTLVSCQSNTTDVSDRQDVINFSLTGTEDKVEEQATQDAWVDFDSSLMAGEDTYYSQTLKLTYNGTKANPICNRVRLYVKKTGTMTSSHKVNVFITATESDAQSVDHPDFGKVYAEGQLIGTSVTSTTGEWIYVPMTYWDYPQNCYDGVPLTSPKIAIAITTEGNDAVDYISWGYNSAGGYGNGRMVNSDAATPTSQEDYDYAFEFNGKWFENEATVETDSFLADSGTFVYWKSVVASIDKSTFNDYTRYSKLQRTEYALSDNGSSWDAWVELESDGDIAGTKLYIKFKFSFRRPYPQPYNWAQNDSFTLISIKVSYVTQDVIESLIASVVWEGKYLLACDVADSGG